MRRKAGQTKDAGRRTGAKEKGAPQRLDAAAKQQCAPFIHTPHKKGFVHVDYIIAIGVIIVIFGVTIVALTNFLVPAQETAELQAITTNAFSLLTIADFPSSPAVWNNTQLPERIGLQTKAYTFFVLVNNTAGAYINQSQSVIALDNELVNFSFGDIGFAGVNINSTVVTDDANRTLSYEISGEEIRFAAVVNASQARWYTVSFDDDSNFTSRSSAVTATNNISEKLLPVRQLSVLQYRQIRQLNVSSYTLVKNRTSTAEFHVRLTDLNTSDVLLDYGADVPRRGDVVALQRFVAYQNATANVNTGRLVVQTW